MIIILFKEIVGGKEFVRNEYFNIIGDLLRTGKPENQGIIIYNKLY